MKRPSKIAEAKYRECSGGEAGNPWLEALPPIRTRAEIQEGLAIYPPGPGGEAAAGPEENSVRLGELRYLFHPRNRDVEMTLHLQNLIREAYLDRNPIGPGFVASLLRGIAKEAAEGAGDEEAACAGAAAAVIGMSGSGKSSSIEAALRCIPRCIRHRSYKGTQLLVTQLVHLKVNCGKRGSILLLLKRILQAIDAAIGTEYYTSYNAKRATSEELELYLTRLFRIHGVSMLVIDEIQNLREARGKEEQIAINFVTSLVNNLGVVVVLVGTSVVEPLLAKTFISARRAGADTWYYKPQELDAEFLDFAELLWDYQRLERFVEYEPSSGEMLHYYCQGIYAIAVKLFVAAQRLAMSEHAALMSEYENAQNQDPESAFPKPGPTSLDHPLFERAWQEKFKPLHRFMDLMRAGSEIDDDDFAKAMKEVDEALDVAEAALKESDKATVKRTKKKAAFDIPNIELLADAQDTLRGEAERAAQEGIPADGEAKKGRRKNPKSLHRPKDKAA